MRSANLSSFSEGFRTYHVQFVKTCSPLLDSITNLRDRTNFESLSLLIRRQISTVAHPLLARACQSSSDPRQAGVSITGIHPTRSPQSNHLILRLVPRLLTWSGSSHRWCSSQSEMSFRTLAPVILGRFLNLTVVAALGNPLWTPVVLGVTAILLGSFRDCL